MDTSYHDGALRTHTDNYHNMRSSNDHIFSESVHLSSLGVVDLDTSIVPDAFGLSPGIWFPENGGLNVTRVRILVPDAEATP